MANHPNRSKKKDSPGRNPRPEEIRAAREAAGLTQEQAGALVYSSWRTWQDWEAGIARMHPAFWELWRIKTGRPQLARATQLIEEWIAQGMHDGLGEGELLAATIANALQAEGLLVAQLPARRGEEPA